MSRPILPRFLFARRRRGSWWRPVLALLITRLAIAPIGLLGRCICGAALVVVVAPWLLARLVTIPLGLVRASAFLGWLADDVWDGDQPGGRLVGGAWALLHRSDAASVSRLERLAHRPGPLGPAGLVGAGLLAAAQGDRARARGLLASVDLLPTGALPAAAERLAVTWRLADALASADWAAAESLAVRLGWRARVLALSAARIGGLAQVSDGELKRAWQLSLRPSVYRSLVQRALAVRAPATTPAAPETPVATGGPLAAALARHAALAATVPTADDLVAAAAAWDTALGRADGASSWAVPRAAALGLSDGRAALTALAADVEADLSEAALASGVAVPDGSGMLQAVQRRVRQRLLEDVEAACRALETRVGAGRWLPAVLEWTELLALRARHDRLGRMGGLPLRRLVLVPLHGAVCPLACHLWNDRRQHALAGAIFRWLLAEAEAVGDTRLAEHERRNVGIAR